MPYVLRIPVSPSDIDELAHVGNVVYLRWVQEAAMAHSRAVGLGLDHYLARGAAFVVTRHEIDYLRPALAGDEVEVETRVAAITTATSERRTAIRRARDGELLARAVTRWAYVDLATGRPARIPEDVRARFPVEPAPAGSDQPLKRRA